MSRTKCVKKLRHSERDLINTLQTTQEAYDEADHDELADYIAINIEMTRGLLNHLRACIRVAGGRPHGGYD